MRETVRAVIVNFDNDIAIVLRKFEVLKRFYVVPVSRIITRVLFGFDLRMTFIASARLYSTDWESGRDSVHSIFLRRHCRVVPIVPGNLVPC